MSVQKMRFAAAVALGLTMVLVLFPASAQDVAPPRAVAAEVQNWRTVAPGRVEPASQQIRLATMVSGHITQALVEVGDLVVEGEALIRIDNDEISTRLAKAGEEVSLRKRARANPPLPKDAPERQAADAEEDAEQTVVRARYALDRLTLARRSGAGSEGDQKAATAALSAARVQVQKRKDELTRFEVSNASVVPSELEGQLAAARIEFRGAQSALDELTIRAPLAGTILQLGARAGELTSPSATLPLVVLADLTSLRVRAELDEREYGTIRTGQQVVVRSDAFPGHDFAGKVASIAPIIAPGKFGARGQGSFTDIDVAEVLVDLTEHGPLIVGMKVDVYFRQ